VKFSFLLTQKQTQLFFLSSQQLEFGLFAASCLVLSCLSLSTHCIDALIERVRVLVRDDKAQPQVMLGQSLRPDVKQSYINKVVDNTVLTNKLSPTW
jgi:hypothetical protein